MKTPLSPLTGREMKLVSEPSTMDYKGKTYNVIHQHEKVKEHLGEKTLSEKLLSYRPDCFELVEYQSHPTIKAQLSN